MSPRRLGERSAIAAITALAAVVRLAAIAQPMRYDESVTWAYFVGRPWGTIVGSYQFPNNHVFFSLLAKVTSSLAPFQPWALRLPAFLAGVALVPLTWAVGRRYASPAVGLLGAAFAAGATALVLYSTNARGYSLVAALFLVLLLLADRLRMATRLGDWMAFAIVGALGLYTIPVMLYPLGIAAGWLLLAARAEGDPARRRRLAIGATVSTLAAGAMAIALYLPIIRTAGFGVLAGNRFVQPSPWPVFLRAVPRHLLDTLVAWTAPLPWWHVPVVLGVAFVGLPRGADVRRPSLALAAALWCGFLLAATHRVPFVRVWLFLLPLFLLAVARGALRLAAHTRASRPLQRLGAPAGATIAALIVTVVALASDAARHSDDTGAFRAAREVTSVLADELRAGDRVLAPIPTNGPLLYYFDAAALDTALLTTPPAATRRAFLVLDPQRGQTLDWAVRSGMIDPREYDTPTLLLQRTDAELWRSVRR